MAATDTSTRGSTAGRGPGARGPGGAGAPVGIVGQPAGTDGPAASGDAGGEEGGKKKSKKKLVIVVALVVVIGAAGYLVKGRSHKVVYKPGQAVPAGKVSSLGTLTVNTSDGHLVQVGIDLQLTTVAQTKTVSTDRPQLRNAAIADLGNQTYQGLLAPSGRTALQHQLLASFQQVLGPVDGAAPQVSAVYFTTFVLQ